MRTFSNPHEFWELSVKERCDLLLEDFHTYYEKNFSMLDLTKGITQDFYKMLTYGHNAYTNGNYDTAFGLLIRASRIRTTWRNSRLPRVRAWAIPDEE